MKGEVQVYHHLGLGDHIICNGLMRQLCTKYRTVYCFVKQHYLSSVSFMYRDEAKIKLVPVDAPWEVPLRINPAIDLIKIGFEKLLTSSLNFDASFYQQLGLDFSLRWDKFYIERDYNTERDLLLQLNPHNEPYIFVHDDPGRGLFADLTLLRKDLRIVKASDYFGAGAPNRQFQKYTFFHWILVLENAHEIHCMDSSFKCLVESLQNLGLTNLFFHRYVKGPRAACTTRKNWIVIKRPSVLFMAKNLTRRIHRKFVKLWHAQVVQPNQRPSSQ